MKRGKPLARRTPLKRSPMKRRRAKPRRTNSGRDPGYKAWCRRQPCAARAFALDHCGGRVDPDHTGRRGMGQIADDRSCIPLCRHHHRCRADFTGPFRGWDQAAMRAWMEREVTSHNHEYTMFVVLGRHAELAP